MAPRSWFSPPPLVKRSIPTRRSPADVAAWVRGAVAQSRVSDPVENSPYVIALDGTADARTVRLRGRFRRADGRPERSPLPLTAIGSIRPDGDGAVLDIAIGVGGTNFLIVLVVATAVMIGLAISAGLAWPGIVFVLWLAVLWLLVRAGQRYSLRFAPQFEAFIEELANGR